MIISQLYSIVIKNKMIAPKSFYGACLIGAQENRTTELFSKNRDLLR